MAEERTHTCGWIGSPIDKYCRGCGERLMKISREYNEIKAEMEALREVATSKPNPALAAISMTLFNVLAWASGEAQVRPVEMLKEMERMVEKWPGGFGFQPPGGEPPK